MTNENIDKLKIECWNSSVHAFATAYIFEERARLLKKRIIALDYIGIALPIAFGAAAILLLGNSSEISTILGKIIISGSGILGVMELLGSAISLIHNWHDNYAYAQDSNADNKRMSKKYRSLALEITPDNYDESISKYSFLNTHIELRDELDEKQLITDEEKRMGMRAALREFQRKCASCKEIPTDMSPSDCGVCGQFKRRKI